MSLPSPSVLLGVPGFSAWYPGQESAFSKALDWYHSPSRFLGMSLPTGSGKTILALLLATLSGARTVILTATKGLQTQYLRDAAALGGVEVKGQNNFRCPLVPTLSADEGPCHEGLSCSYSRSGGCPYRVQLQQAIDSQIVITNYAYYLAQTNYSSGLGSFGLLVCVPGETEITLADGSTENIESLVARKSTSLVKSVNLVTGELVDSCITDWHKVKYGMRLLHISTDMGSIDVTPDHEIWTRRGYVQAGHLVGGDIVYGYPTKPRTVGGWEPVGRRQFATAESQRWSRESSPEGKPFLEAAGSSRCQAENLGRVGDYGAEEGRQWGLGRVQLPLYDALFARVGAILPTVLPSWKEGCISGVVGFGRCSGSSLALYGQRKPSVEQIREYLNALVWRGWEQPIIRLARQSLLGGESCGRGQSGERLVLGAERIGSRPPVCPYTASYPANRQRDVVQGILCHTYGGVYAVWEDLPSCPQRTLLLSGVPGEGTKAAGSCMVSEAKVTRVEWGTPRDYVYDITVEGTHNFFANGHLVKNCDEAHQAFSALENHLTVYLDRMGLESCGVQLPSLPTSEVLAAASKSSKKTPATKKTVPTTDLEPEQPPAPNLWAQWQSWASSAAPSAQSHAEELGQEIHELREKGSPVSGALSRSYRSAKSIAAKLESLSSGQGDRIIQRAHYGMVFTPRWVSGSGHVLFQSVPKLVLMSAILSHKTADSIGVPAGEQRSWLEVGSYFPPKNTQIWHIPTARINFRTDDYGTILWQSRIDQIIQRRLDRKGIVFTVSYERARLLLSRSQHKGIMLTHSTGDVFQVVERFKRMAPPAVLVSPTVTTGWDFPGNGQPQYIIIGKIPYPDSQNVVLQARHEDDKDWSSYLAMETLIQESGRMTRGAEDKTEIFCVDDSILWYMKAYRHFAPKWFLERWRGSLPCVPDALF